LRIGPGAGHRQAFHGQHRGNAAAVRAGFGNAGRVHFVVLQPVELTRAERTRGGRGAHHHLDDGGRETLHRVHRRAQVVATAGNQVGAGLADRNVGTVSVVIPA